MKVILKDRRKGKTFDIVQIARKENATVVCINRSATFLLTEEYPDVKAITFYQFLNQEKDRHTKKYVIDNLDICLNHVLSNNVVAVSMNLEEKE